LMWRPQISFGNFFGIVLSMFLAQDAAGAWIGIIVAPASSRLIALIATVFLSLLNGFPDVPFIFKGFFAHWQTVLLTAGEYEATQNMFDMFGLTNGIFPSFPGDPIGKKGMAIGIVILWIVGMKLGTFLTLVWQSKR
jgi:hypothetical protein